MLALSGCGSLSVLSSSGENAASVNAFRAANGRSQLRSDSTLTGLAKAHAEDMARRGSLDHNGFMERRGPAGARAENVAYGCNESACTIKQWINSSGHRKNMLIPELTRYGMASAVSSNGRRYWALELGD